MLNGIIESSLNNRFFVLMATFLVCGLGMYSALHLPIDAVPDLTNVQVQVITEAPALSPVEADALLAFPVSGAMSGLPDVEQIRSVSKFGVSVVTVVFKEGTDIYRARQLVGERIPRAAEAIPPGYGAPMLGPIATALGEVFQFQVKATKESGLTPMDLHTILDWFIAYQLRRVEGVTEINAHGGEMKTYEVEPDPDELAARRAVRGLRDLTGSRLDEPAECILELPGEIDEAKREFCQPVDRIAVQRLLPDRDTVLVTFFFDEDDLGREVAAGAAPLLGVVEAEEAELAGAAEDGVREPLGVFPGLDVGSDLGVDEAPDRLAELIVLRSEDGVLAHPVTRCHSRSPSLD